MKSTEKKSTGMHKVSDKQQQARINKEILYNQLFNGKITLSEYWVACKS